jgi:PAS domain S-box-containing protein
MAFDDLLKRDDISKEVRSLIRAEIERESADAKRYEVVEENLQRSKSQYRDLFNSIADPIFVFDASTHLFLDANTAALKRYGYSLDEMKCMIPQQLHPPKELMLVESRILDEGDEALHHYTHVTKSGKTLMVEVHTGSVIFEGKNAYISIARDVSDRFRIVSDRFRIEEERREIELQSMRSQKLESLGVLASGLAHDLNNLLAGILGYSDLALSQLSSEHSARSNVERAIQGAEGAADLARQMLAYAGRGRMSARGLDLSALVRDNVHLLNAGLPKGVQLKTDLSEAPTFIEADGGQIQRVVMNLALNGSEAIGEKSGCVLITTGCETLSADNDSYSRFIAEKLPPGRYVFLEVQDDGSGMDESTLSRVFDPFFTTKLDGRGLGLAALLGIVRGHKGGISVESEIGKGTTFRLVFPVAERGAEIAEPVVSEVRLEGTVLVIDDENSVLEMVREILSTEGVTVLTAQNGVDGVALYGENRNEIRLVLLDYSMPNMNGEETFMALRKISSDVPILLSSGFGREEIAKRSGGMDLAGFIQKPYRLAALLAEIRSCFDRHVLSAAEKKPPTQQLHDEG